MIKLYQFPRMKDFPNMSPFCVKVETYLKMSGLPHEVKLTSNTRAAPKNKFPYIVDGKTRMGDSTLIIDYLKNTYGDKIDTHLTEEEKSIALAFQRQFEEYLVMIGVYFRWVDDAGWKSIRPQVFKGIPFPLSLIIPNLVRKSISLMVVKQGVGNHSREEILGILRKDLKALSTFLNNKKYFMGEKVSTLDATAFGFLGNMTYDLVENSELKKAIHEFPNLEAYAKRMKEQYFP
jgi:glutathione S-transferase